jgi:phage regulator Rha-like protein
MELQAIQSKIYEIRGRRVMLDRDLAAMYGIETKRLKEAVRRNITRFEGEDFMFEPTAEELSRSQIVTLNEDERLRTQIATLKNGRGQHSKYLPFAFTEMGVAMLSSVLNSATAIEINRGIMRAFVAMRHIVMTAVEISEIRKELELLRHADESILESVNDLSENTREEIDTLYEAIGELSLKVLEPPKRPRRPIGYRRAGED